ncbi:hypothetical protein FOYG_09005 [Fusarium oxysporum NRRL 32931]|uniref:Uncharacterized protein n=1 Tax=Fusarium oxysporum NRRL 32931 TaxID=660029 RepID=W9IGZ6_FUSOX|nr:hypothetical protein FOYG_09005 [Fusarium oxysporum NRRL 32931]
MCSETLQKVAALSTVTLHPTTARLLEATRDARYVVMQPEVPPSIREVVSMWECCNCGHGWMILALNPACSECQVPRCQSCTYI